MDSRRPPITDKRYDILDVRVGTDPTLTMKTRRGTGYYKIPSLKGVWYRGPFEHNGSVATLEDWFDPARLKDDYVPTGLDRLRRENARSERPSVRTESVGGRSRGAHRFPQDAVRNHRATIEVMPFSAHRYHCGDSSAVVVCVGC